MPGIDLISIGVALRMIGIMFLILAAFVVVVKMLIDGEFTQEVKYPWEKEEQKAEKMRQKALTKKQWYED